MTLDTPSADAAPTRRSRRAVAPSAEPSATTRAELRRRAAAAQAASVDAVEELPTPDVESVAAAPSLAETVVAAPSLAETVVAEVAAAIVAESIGAEPDLPTRRRLREAAREVFEVVAETPAPAANPTSAETDAEASAVPAAEVDVEAPVEAEVDEFAYAARLFAFSDGAHPPRQATVEAPLPVVAVHVAPRRPRGALLGKVAAGSFSIGAMAIVGLLAVGTTTPAEALGSVSPASAREVTTASAPTASAAAIQAFVASGGTDAGGLNRSESYGVESLADVAAAGGVRLFAGTWVNDPSAKIQWPFPVGVPISAAYGSTSYLSEFSMPHHGVDLTPGVGAEIHVIAAGTVRIATEAGGDYGVTVVVDHIIDGELVSTRYAHMQRGSLTVEVGDTVTAGEVIGKVGQTGKATGPHLHFEVLLNGVTPTDPMAWMYAHTTGTHTVG